VIVVPRLCGVTEPQRHGLACDIPLPPNTTFDRQVELPGGNLSGVASQTLQYHVANTTNDAIHTFYVQQLPTKGWKCIRGDDPTAISGAQGNRGLTIGLAPPSGSSSDVTLVISVATFTKDIDTSAC
jgi:hypothetical protein